MRTASSAGQHRFVGIFVSVIIIAIIAVCAFSAHVARLRNTARESLRLVSQIQTVEDADRLMARRTDRLESYSDATSPAGDRSQKTELNNGILAGLRIVPSSGLTIEVVTRSRNLQLLLVGFYTARSSVWIQEEFESTSREINVRIERDPRGTPQKVLIIVPSALPDAQKRDLFEINYDCLVLPGGCKTPGEILPAFIRLEQRKAEM